MKLKDFIIQARASLGGLYPAEEARAIVSRLCSTIPGVTPQTHLLEQDFEIPSPETLLGYLDRLLNGEPLQYVLGKADFYGHEFKVSPAVLIPRPETEELVDYVVKHARRASRILDLCTGSGCIAWSLAASVEDSEVCAVDISGDALAVASGQSVESPSKPRFLKGDVLAPETLGPLGIFDVIVSNPPYVMERERALMRRNVLEHEPALALFVPDEDPLLFYRNIAAIVSSQLAPGGFGIVEINEALGVQTAALFKNFALSGVSVRKDFFGRDRFVVFSR